MSHDYGITNKYTLPEVREMTAKVGKYNRHSHEYNTLLAQHDESTKNLNEILSATRGKARLADEQRTVDKLMNETEAIGAFLSAFHAREAQGIALRAPIYDAIYGGGESRTDTFGAAIANAIAEVRDGRTTAFVDVPNQRALSTTNSGGYGIVTDLANPISALAASSIVYQIPGINQITATTGDRMRFPRWNAATVGGVAEGASLTAANTTLNAVDVIFTKYSSYETLSTELEEDSNFPALQALGARLIKDLAVAVDSGLLQGTGAASTVGLFNQAGVSTTSMAALPADFDKLLEVIYQMEQNDGNPSAWLLSPRSWRILQQIKTGLASDKTTLLSPDSQSAARTLLGLPVLQSSSISDTTGATSVGSTVALVDGTQLAVVTRREPRLEISRDVNFSTDQIAVRCTTRVGLAVYDAAGGVSLLTDLRAS